MNYIRTIFRKPSNYVILFAHFSNMLFAGNLYAESNENQSKRLTLSGIDGTSNYTETVCPGFALCFDLFSGAADKSRALTLIYDGNLPGSTFASNLERQPTGHFCWTPELNDARTTPYDFNITVMDEEDPSVKSTFHYSISVPFIKADISTADVTCFGNSDGMAIVTASGGSGNYLYQWIGHENNTASIRGLGAGEVTVQVMDDFGCTATASKMILSPQPLVLDAITKHATFQNAGGEAEVLASGGTMPYTYSWLPGDASNERIEHLPSGVYTAVVTDANGCTAYKQVNISTVLPAASSENRTPMEAAEDKMSSVLIYPNPAAEQFTVQNISDNTIIVSVISSLGQDVYHTINVPANLSVNIPMDDQGTGIYLVKVLQNQNLETFRLVKN